VLKIQDKGTRVITAAADRNGAGESANIVVLRGGERQFGLVVDQINDTEEIVVKPLGKQLKGVNVFAGATIMGDGRVALILDVMGLAQKANVVSQTADETSHDGAGKSDTVAADQQMLLLCKLQGGRRMAIPLSVVARLEEFQRSALEEAGGQVVVQYRGQIMPLVDVADVLADERTRARMAQPQTNQTETDTIQVVVYSHDSRNVGLRVEQVLDIVEQRVQLQSTAARAGVRGTIIIKEKVTELLDVKAVVESTAHLTAAA
jgi:two-component system chemotaxis sensor kinase CheA